MLISSTKQLDGVETGRRHVDPPSTPTVVTAADAADDETTPKQLDDVLSSLDAAFRFMNSEAKNMNLDAIIGTRMVQGLSASTVTR